MQNITKRFGKVTALKDVNLEVKEGEVHALVGENGAGKSTLMNVLSGIYPYGSYEGDIIFDNETCKFSKIHDSESKGIVIIHQELAMVPYLSIAENMFLGNERTAAYSNGVIDWPRTFQRAKELMDLVGLDEDPHTLIKDIGVGKQQLVEIAKAISKNCRLLILDEPTASLNESESQKLLDLIAKFREEGMTSIIISHKLKISDEVLMEITDWTVHHPLNLDRKVNDNVAITIHKGEVVGLAGLMGAGRTEFAKSLFGKSYGTKISGHVKIHGKEVHLNTVSDAIAAGLAYVTEDRKGDGLVLENPISTNMTLANLEGVSDKGVIDHDLELKTAKELKQDLNVKCATVLQNVGNLSGGNQQKVLLAKWIFAHPDVLILDEPTRGIDVGAKYEIYCLINKLVEQGKAVLMISSELPEVLGMSDTVYVMNEGKIVAKMPRSEASQESIMGAILRTSGKKRTLEQ